MYFIAEAICILLRLNAGLCEKIDNLSPAEARDGTELGNICLCFVTIASLHKTNQGFFFNSERVSYQVIVNTWSVKL